MAPKKGRRNKHIDDDDEADLDAGVKAANATDGEVTDKPTAPKKTSKKKQVPLFLLWQDKSLHFTSHLQLGIHRVSSTRALYQKQVSRLFTCSVASEKNMGQPLFSLIGNNAKI